MSTPNWYQALADGSGYHLRVYIQPNAKKSEVVGLHGNVLKIRIACPPVDGKANAALIAFVAERCEIPRQRITLRQGETSRSKVIAIQTDLSPSQLVSYLLP